MTDIETTELVDELAAGPWAEGDTITVLEAGVTANFARPGFGGQVYRRGDIIRVTRATLEHQAALLALVEDADAQLRRWGVQKFARGTLQLDRWTQPGDAEWILARDRERAIAQQEADPAERARKLTDINTRYGRVPTSTSVDLRRGQSYQERQLSQAEYDRQQRGDRFSLVSRAE